VARCRLLLLLVLVVVVLTARGVGAEPSSHMEVARATSGAPLDPHATGTAIDLERSFRAAENQTRQLAVIDANLSAKTSALATLNQEILANQVHLGTVRDRIRSRAATLYQRGDSTSGALLDVGSVSDIKSAQQYAAAAMTIDTKQLAALTDTERDLEAQRSARTQEHDDLVDKQSRVSSSIADLQQRRDSDRTKLDAWGAVPVMGDAIVTPAELAGWYRSTGQTARLASGTTIDDLARLFIVEGRAEHVRGDLAFAQAMVETGGLQVAAGNNYSGIGVCDSCRGGYSFPTPLDGVRAQIQLLRNYADPDSRASTLANTPSPSLYGGNPGKAAFTYDSFFLKGKAPLWNQMGGGNWATDPTYAPKVIGLFNAIVAYAAQHPA
jgi:hypothetical protein